MAKVDRSTGEVLEVKTFSLPVLRSAYDDFSDRAHASDLTCSDPSRTDQSGKEEADINVLVRRFGLGQVPVSGVQAPWYGDFTDLRTPHEMAQQLVEAQAAFMRLPAQVRLDFDNDPYKFVEFCSQEENYDKICDLGLLAPEPMEKRVQARKAAEAAALKGRVDAEILARQKQAEEPRHS